MKKKKIRHHNEYFRAVALRNRKSCPTCHVRLDGCPILSWGEYRRARWYTVSHFCKSCIKPTVLDRLTSHADPCGCIIDFQWEGAGPHPDDLPTQISEEGVVSYPRCEEKPPLNEGQALHALVSSAYNYSYE